MCYSSCGCGGQRPTSAVHPQVPYILGCHPLWFFGDALSTPENSPNKLYGLHGSICPTSPVLTAMVHQPHPQLFLHESWRSNSGLLGTSPLLTELASQPFTGLFHPLSGVSTASGGILPSKQSSLTSLGFHYSATTRGISPRPKMPHENSPAMTACYN